MLYLTNIDNHFVFRGNLGLVTQVVHFFLTCSFAVLKLNSLFISFISTEYTGIFFMDELTSVSIRLDSVLIGLFIYWLMRLIMFKET